MLLKPIYTVLANVGHRRVRRYMNGSVALDMPVISVGNITFGGTSKTPIAGVIAKELHAEGFKPGIVLRGYRGRIDREKLSPEVVSDGEEIFLDWRDAGDEARQIAEQLINDNFDIPVAVGRNRAAASELLINRHGIDLIILDDGYQYSKLRRDFDIVLVDAMRPFGNLTLGNGLLREPLLALKRADAVLVTHTEAVEKNRIDDVTRKIRKSACDKIPVYNTLTKVKRVGAFPSSAEISVHELGDMRYLGFAGIGNIRSFEFTLNNLPGELSGFIGYPDHHPYTKRDIGKIARKSRAMGVDMVLTTSKDAVRLREFSEDFDFKLGVVEINIEIDRQVEFFSSVLRKLHREIQMARRAG